MPIQSLIVHLGIHKTGSTAIQFYLWSKQRELREHGVLYPREGRPLQTTIQFGHHSIAWAATGRTSVEGTVERVMKELHEATDPMAVISSEEFDRLEERQVRDLLACLRYPTTVVFYYRRQSDVLQGLYGTDIVYNRVTLPIRRYAETLDVELDYWRLATRWANVVGANNILVRPYRRQLFPRHDIVADFCQSLRIPYLASVRDNPIALNLSLPTRVALAVQQLWCTGIPAEYVYKVISALRLAHTNSAPYEFMSPAEAHEFDLRFVESNRRFVAEFCPEHSPIEPRSPACDHEWHSEYDPVFASVNNHLKSSLNAAT